jgi:hypothetical protein
LREDIGSIHARQRATHEEKFSHARVLSWFDWLAERAAMGDAQALATLRKRQRTAFGRASALLGVREEIGQGRAQQRGDKESALNTRIDGVRIDSVTKQGTVIYADGKSAIRDSGRRLEVSEGIKQDGLEVALAMAVKRFGQSLTIEGDDAFRQRVLSTAQALQLDIPFTSRTRRAESQALPPMTGGRTHAGIHGHAAADELSVGVAAAKRYIAERETKRQAIAGIPRHVLGKQQDKEAEYAGWRKVDGQLLLLVKTGADEIAVLPMDTAMFARVSRAKLGEKINLDNPTPAQLRGLSRGLKQ